LVTRMLSIICVGKLLNPLLNWNLMECLLVGLKKERYIKELSEVNRSNTAREDRHIDVALLPIGLDMLCYIHYLAEPWDIIATSLLNISLLI
jgi:hypothetical protein